MTQTLDLKAELHIAENREQFFLNLYHQVFPSVAKYVHRHHGSVEDARDVFHDALILLYEKKVAGQRYECEEGYVFGIAKHLWLRKINSLPNHQSCEAADVLSIAEGNAPDIKTTEILTLLETAGQRCMKLLKNFYFDKVSLAAIKESFGFSSVRSATVQKYKCIEKLREVVRNKTKRYEDFFE